MFIRSGGIYIFFFVRPFSGFGVWVIMVLEIGWEVFSPLYLGKEFEKDWC